MRTDFVRCAAAVLVPMILTVAEGCSPKRWAEQVAAGYQARPKSFRAVEETLFSRSHEVPALGRQVAQLQSRPRCLSDRFNRQQLLEDVAKAEREYGGAPGDATIGTKLGSPITLRRIPAAQVDYLKIVERVANESAAGRGLLIELTGVSHQGCGSVPCLLNRVYGKSDDDLIGWVLYDFYLRTGYVLNAGRRIMSYTDSQYYSIREGASLPALKLADFLWSPEELRALWAVSRTFGKAAFRVPSLDRIYRMPRGRGIVEPGHKPPVCGVASALFYGRVVGGVPSGYFDPMWIQVTDRCLTLEQSSALFAGEFFVGLTHEIAHHMDYSTQVRGRDSISTQDAWRSLSGGWRQEERVAQNGQTYVWWVAGRDEFVSTYALSSPAEDWAETVAYARYRGNKAAREVPGKVRFLSERLFDGRSFDDVGLRRHYARSAAGRIKDSAAGIVSECLRTGVAPSQGGAGSASPLAVSIPEGVPAGSASCIQERFGREFALQMERLRETEMEACSVLDADQSLVQREVSALLGDSFVSDLISQAELERVEREAIRLRAELQSRLDAREVWLACRPEREPQPCYLRTLGSAFDSVAEPYRAVLGDGHLSLERERFIQAHPFASVGRDAEAFFLRLLRGAVPMIQEYAQARLGTCVQAGAQDQPVPPTLPFTGGQIYVAGQVLSCINHGFEADLRVIDEKWSETNEGRAISDPVARQYMRELLAQEYLRALQVHAEQSAAAETRRREPIRQEAVARIHERLVSDPSWVGDASRRDAVGPLCLPQGQHEFDAWLDRRTQSGSTPIPLHFEALENLRTQWANEACQKAIADPRLLRDQDVWSDVLKQLEGLVARRADSFAVACRRQSNSVARASCLRNGWPTIEGQAMTDWDASAEGQRHASRRREALAHIRSSEVRARLQAAAILRMEQR